MVDYKHQPAHHMVRVLRLELAAAQMVIAISVDTKHLVPMINDSFSIIFFAFEWKGAGALYAGATAGQGVDASASLNGDLNQGFGVGQASASYGGIHKEVIKTVSTNADDNNNENAAANVETSEHNSSFDSSVSTQHMQLHHHTSNAQSSHVETSSHVDSIESNSVHHNIDNNQNSYGYLPPDENAQSSNNEWSTHTGTSTSTTTLAPVVTVNSY